ncbi:hypothetical protein [Morganella morganii]|uniref:hypothetical protein n=1 Tax=Morganella morganii TaxID=582 RepID=UPI0015F6D5BC|nr:hypothetical protein [Morganella morganii]MBA5855901.1 hypothetical protein [Morganella morganii]MBT0308351.1 hypothetical protein [Morganella morganii subsp. morganii]HCT4687364.1 hypothetical protein [Morganella morganii]
MNNNDLLNATFETGLQIVKTLILVNGGAVIALLALLGNVWNSGVKQTVMVQFTSSMLGFGVGIFFSILTICCAFLGNFLQTLQQDNRWINNLITASLISMFTTAIFSIGCFIYGVYESYSGMLLQFQ